MQPLTTLKLGDMEFFGFGVPEKIPGGGDHMVAVHQLPGGVRVVDAMGADDGELKWSGIFFGNSGTAATDQAQFLDNLRKTGKQVTLTWDIYTYSVLVSSLRWDFERHFQIPYEITCTVIEDQTQPVTTAPSSSTDDYVNADMASGLSSASNRGMTVPSGVVAPFSSTIGATGAAGLAITAGVSTPLGTLGTTLSIGGGAISASSPLSWGFANLQSAGVIPPTASYVAGTP